MNNRKSYIAFDQFQRYETVAKIIDHFREENDLKTFQILELGANEHKDLGLFLPNDKILFTDITLTEAMKSDPDFMRADGTALSFGDDSFDFVIALDVLEHIPADKREQFISEVCRVSRNLAVLSFPFEAEYNVDAEARVNSYYKTIADEDFIWLSEHNVNGLPDINVIDEILEKSGAKFFSFRHGDIRTWEKMWYCHFDTVFMPETLNYRENIDHYYNMNIYSQDVSEHCYRAFYVMSRKLDLSELNKFTASLWQAPCHEKTQFLNILFQAHKDAHLLKSLDKRQNVESNKGRVYFGFDIFSEEHAVEFTFSGNELKTGRINIPQGCTQIRFDPIENYGCVVGNLIIGSSNGILTVKGGNFTRTTGGNYYFSVSDPMLFPELPSGTSWIEISCRVAILDNDFKQNVIYMLESELDEKTRENAELIKKHENEISELSEEAAVLQKKVADTKTQLSARMAECDNYRAECGDLRGQVVYWRNAYNIISNSQFWKITLPARKILDGIKWLLKRNKVTYLIGKGILSLKRVGFKATWRKVKYRLSVSARIKALAQSFNISPEDRQVQESTVFDKNIKISVLVPLYNTPKQFLEEMIASVVAQTYPNWELCLADGSDKDHKEVGEIIKKLTEKDKRIRYKKLEKNLGIAENTNACIDMSTGDYIALFDHDDILHPSAFYEVMKAVCEEDADFIYTDETVFRSPNLNDITTTHFKPDYAPDNLKANNYICHLSVFSKELLKLGGKFRRGYDGSQDHDLVLRLTDKAKKIVHIPKVLYFWRSHPMSVAMDIGSKSYAVEAGIRAVSDFLTSKGVNAKVSSSRVCQTIYRIEYEIKSYDKVSIIIPNRDHPEDLKKCIDSILGKTAYPDYEIVIVDNGSVDEDLFKYYDSLKSDDRFVICSLDIEFNYSRLNNYAVTFASGKYYILLNNDIEIITDNWIDEMLMYAQRDDVGAVGAKLYYPDNTIQHAGVILGLGAHRIAGHAFIEVDKNEGGYMGRLGFAQNMSAVTAACMMVKASVYREVNGFDEDFKVAYNDVDFCLKIRKAGYLIVWTPYAEAYHYESKSRGKASTPRQRQQFKIETENFKKKWFKELEAGDPYYNPNLSLDYGDFRPK